MSVAAPAPSGLKSSHRALRPPRVYFWGVSLLWLAILGWNLSNEGEMLASNATALIPWVASLAVLNLLPVSTWKAAFLSPDTSISAAAAVVLSPTEAGLVTFLATIDPRELRGQVPLAKAAFNRSQVSLAVFVGSLAVHAFADSAGPSPLVIPLTFVWLVLALGVNYVLTAIGASLEHGHPISKVLRRMQVGGWGDFLLTTLSWGMMGAMLAILHDEIGPLALAAFMVPTLLGRQALIRSQTSIDTGRAYRSREAALAQISHQILEERNDERRLIAADLHDEVLQPLFKVTLMAHVLKADLASGRLMAMDQDLPELLTAADLASSTLRELIGDLRRSALGRGGLGPALSSLVRSLSKQIPIRIHPRIERVTLDPDSELVFYQIAKEALSNAVSHSRATNVWVRLFEHDGVIALTVKDDGSGFDPLEERSGHYGIAIMRERASAVGAHLSVDSSPSLGCTIELSVRDRKESHS